MTKSIFEVKIIGHIRTDFPGKFGVPRQSGIVETLEGRIEFEKEYAQPEAFRGLDHLAVFRSGKGKMVGYGTPAPAGR